MLSTVAEKNDEYLAPLYGRLNQLGALIRTEEEDIEFLRIKK